MPASRPARRALQLLAAVALTAAGLVLPGGPAAAVTCSGSHGVSVVVDFHGLGGRGAETACIPTGGGKSARSLFTSAHYTLVDVQKQPGFVCRINGLPTADDDPCVNTPPADAYWGLYWSDGTSGQWRYATAGVDSQKVPDGGSVGFSWNSSKSSTPPGPRPPEHSASPSPTAQPTTHQATGGSGGGTAPPRSPDPGSAPASPSATPSETASPSASASSSSAASGKATGRDQRAARDAEKRAHRARSKRPSADASAATTTDPTVPTSSDGTTTADPAEPDGGLPTWVAPAAILVLFGAAGGAAVVRRRRAGGA